MSILQITQPEEAGKQDVYFPDMEEGVLYCWWSHPAYLYTRYGEYLIYFMRGDRGLVEVFPRESIGETDRFRRCPDKTQILLTQKPEED